MDKNIISDKIQITTCSVLIFRQMLINKGICKNLLTNMEKVQWKPPWLSLSIQLLLSQLVLLHLCSPHNDSYR